MKGSAVGAASDGEAFSEREALDRVIDRQSVLVATSRLAASIRQLRSLCRPALGALRRISGAGEVAEPSQK